MKSSKKLIKAIKQFEGCRLKAYKCPAGVPTIGYGSTKNVYMGLTITYADAEKRLISDLAAFERYVDNLKVCKTQGQFDALVDFCYNLGTASLASSTLLKLIKAKAPVADIQAQFERWVYANNKKLPGLIKRRAWEAKRWAE